MNRDGGKTLPARAPGGWLVCTELWDSANGLLLWISGVWFHFLLGEF